MDASLLAFFMSNARLLAIKSLEHIYLAFSAIFIAILIGLPLGIWIMHRPQLRNIVLSITNVFQTIPSLALLAFLIPLLGIGAKPTIVTLTLYALLPITRNTLAGLCSVPPESIEAANGLGFTHWQRLRIIELPLATPIIIAGIRTATAITIGIATVAAFIGAGGLGDFITQGLALDNTRLILLGAIPAALLALLFDFIIATVETSLSQRKRRTLKYPKIKWAIVFILLFTLPSIILSPWLYSSLSHSKNTIVIGTKNFSEQFILGYLAAELIQNKTNLRIKKKFNLGSTNILQNALLKAEIDIYPEYTGTAYLVVLKHDQSMSPNKIYTRVKKEYKDDFNLIWLAPLGFNNAQTLAIPDMFAKAHHINNLSDLAKLSMQLTIAAPPEFLRRADAFPGLAKTYGFQFKKIFQVQPDLVYRAIENKTVDVIEVSITDGRIAADHLVPLADDRHFYLPYEAAFVIRASVLKNHPDIALALSPLSKLIDQQTMQHLNFLVNIKKESPQKVAHDFLVEKGLLPTA